MRVVYLETAVTVRNICVSGTRGTYGRFLEICVSLELAVTAEDIRHLETAKQLGDICVSGTRGSYGRFCLSGTS